MLSFLVICSSCSKGRWLLFSTTQSSCCVILIIIINQIKILHTENMVPVRYNDFILKLWDKTTVGVFGLDFRILDISTSFSENVRTMYTTYSNAYANSMAWLFI